MRCCSMTALGREDLGGVNTGDTCVQESANWFFILPLHVRHQAVCEHLLLLHALFVGKLLRLVQQSRERPEVLGEDRHRLDVERRHVCFAEVTARCSKFDILEWSIRVLRRCRMVSGCRWYLRHSNAARCSSATLKSHCRKILELPSIHYLRAVKNMNLTFSCCLLCALLSQCYYISILQGGIYIETNLSRQIDWFVTNLLSA